MNDTETHQKQKASSVSHIHIQRFVAARTSPLFLLGTSRCLVILLVLMAIPTLLSAQTISRQASFVIKSYRVLPDANYTLDRIIKDTTLTFRRADSINTSNHKACWIKLSIANPYPNDENYVVRLSLPLNYTVYYFDPANGKWVGQNAGFGTANKYREAGLAHLLFSKQATSTVYFKIDLYDARSYPYALKPELIFEKEETLDSREALVNYNMWVSCIVLISFICYNFYLYIYLKDKAYLYFMVAQIGGFIFLHAARQYFNLLFSARLYNIKIVSATSVYIYDINKLLQHLGILLIMFGLIQFTRVYLATKTTLPLYDKLLRNLLYGYAVLEVIPSITTLSGIFHLDRYTILIDNIYIQVMLLMMTVTGVVAYFRKIQVAKFFLLANILPMLLMVAASAYAVLKHRVNPILPELAIFSQILTFGIALVARIKIMTTELAKKELEAVKLEADIKITAYQSLLVEQENKIIISMIETEKDKNDLLTEKLDANKRELVGINLYIHQKKILLSELSKQVGDIDRLYPELRSDKLNDIQSSLRANEYIDAEWNKFKLHFEEVHPRFFDDLKARFPTLTQNDLRLSAYLHINLSTKQIASLLHIVPASVKQAKSRLNKKMNGQLTSK